MTSIGRYTFCECSSLTTITIPNSVTSIDIYAFAYCSSLTSINIPNSVTTVGKGILTYCLALNSIKVEGGNTVYDSRNDCNAIIETTTNTLIAGCKETIIPNSVTSIGENAFCGSCLTSITIPESVMSIGEDAFYGCSNLTSVTFGNGMTSIGRYAFKNCSNLKIIYCNAKETPEVSDITFENVDVSKVMLVVPESAVEKYKAHPVWGQFWIETPTGIESIDNGKLIIDNEVYDISGRKIVNSKSSNRKLPRGINILRMSDGTTRKVLMK